MPTFTYKATYGAELAKQPRILMADFGDGYQQRAGDGINLIRQMWSLEFRKVDADADAIDSFLAGQKGYLSFDWTPPKGAAIKAICRDWRRQIASPGVSVITATFEQVFE
jgi:phage-related protein